MVKDEEDFDFDANFDDILNDHGLNNELVALGWTDEECFQNVFPKNESTKLEQINSVEETLTNCNSTIDISDNSCFSKNLLDLDESEMTLTAEDMEDPELLAQFSLLHQTITKTTPTILQASVPISAVPNTVVISVEPNSTMSGAEAKSVALKFKREGNDAEALRWYRIAKQKEQSEAVNNIAGGGIKVAPINVNKQASKTSKVSVDKLTDTPSSSSPPGEIVCPVNSSF
jgi:hypothetical protein